MPLPLTLQRLGVPVGRPVLVLAGWAGQELSDATRDAVDLLLREVVVPVCQQEEAVVVSGGSNAGVMAALGRAVQDSATDLVLVGVAPNAKLRGYGAAAADEQAAAPEPRHRLIRTPGAEWGDEGPLLVQVAETIAAGRPVLVVAVGGGKGTAREVALAARRGWPSLLLTGHDGTSHRLAAALDVRPFPEPQGKRHRPARTETVTTATVSTILAKLDGTNEQEARDLLRARESNLHAAADLGARDAIRRALRWRLRDDDVLKEAWSRFAVADEVAIQRKKPTATMAGAVLVLATLTVLCALASGWLRPPPGTDAPGREALSDILKGLVTALPLLAGLLLAVIERRARSGTWVEMRASAETLVREIYRWRSRAACGGPAVVDPPTLTDALHEVDRRTGGRASLVIRKAGTRTGTWPPAHLWTRVPVCDCLLGTLNTAVYDEARVTNQLEHYGQAAQEFERKATWLAATIFAVAGVAAFLLALSWRYPGIGVLAAVLASIAAALVSWREYRQRDARVDAMLSTCVAVREARGRWLALQAPVRQGLDALPSYVQEVEDALESEGSDWERGLRLAHQNFTDRHRR